MPSNPRIAAVVQRLADWAQENPWATYFETGRLAIELSDVQSDDLVEAIQHLIASGLLQVKYRAVSPYVRQVLPGDFDTPRLPKQFSARDSAYNAVDADSAEVVQVLVPRSR
jgi:hypothetical protein